MPKDFSVPIRADLIKIIRAKCDGSDPETIALIEAYLFYGSLHHLDVVRFLKGIETGKKSEIVLWRPRKTEAENEVLSINSPLQQDIPKE